MAGREELYLKHIDEHLGRIAKSLEYIVEREKEIKAEQDQWAKEKKELVEPVKKQDKYDEVAEFENAYNIVIETLIKNGMMSCDVDEIDMMIDQYCPKEESDDKNRT